jgi:hypothetical protein
MSGFKDFWHADLDRILRDIEEESSSGYPDWGHVLLEADDLIALALAALESTTSNEGKVQNANKKYVAEKLKPENMTSTENAGGFVYHPQNKMGYSGEDEESRCKSEPE